LKEDLMKKTAIWVLVVWVFFWAFFLVRGFYKSEFKKTRALMSKTALEMKVYITGEKKYAFFNLCAENLPENARYAIEGTLEEIDKRRLVYHLYPRMESDEADFILCYGVHRAYRKAGYNNRVAGLNTTDFILRR